MPARTPHPPETNRYLAARGRKQYRGERDRQALAGGTALMLHPVREHIVYKSLAPRLIARECAKSPDTLVRSGLPLVRITFVGATRWIETRDDFDVHGSALGCVYLWPMTLLLLAECRANRVSTAHSGLPA